MIAVIKPAARLDILNQVGYFGDIERPDLSSRFVEAVKSSIEHITALPLSGSPRYFDHAELEGIRVFPVKGFPDFRIYYIFSDVNLAILRILHGRRDIERVFDDTEGLDY